MIGRLRSVLALFRSVLVPYHRRHRLRFLLTLLGVAIGTQVVVAVQLLNRAVIDSFEETIETIAGSADLQIENSSSGVPEELVFDLEGDPAIASLSGLVQGVVVLPSGELTIFGVDLFADQAVREAHFPPDSVHIEDEFVFSNAKDSVALSRSLMAERGLAEGDSLDVMSPAGPRTLTIRGALDPVGPARLYGGAVGVVDLHVAQSLFGRRGLVDQIDIALHDGADPAAARARIAEALEGRGRVGAPRERAGGLAGMLTNVQTFLTLMSFQAILVGIFLVYHALRTAVVHRRRDLAVSRALGFRGSDLAAAVGAEAVVFGLLGALLGVASGVVLADLALGVVQDGIGAIYERSGSAHLALGAGDVLAALALGIGTAIFAAWLPMREAARVPIIRHIRGGDIEESSEEVISVPWLRAGLALAAGVVAFLLQPGGASPFVQTLFISAGLACFALAVAQLVPALLWSILRLSRPVWRAFDSVVVDLGVESLMRYPARRRGTIAPIMVAFALVLLAGSMVQSLRASILGWVDQTLAADLYLTPTPQLPLPSGGTFPAQVGEKLRAEPGVADLTGSRLIYADLDGRRTVLRSLEARHAFGRLAYPVVASMGGEDRALFESGRGVLVAENLARRAGIQAGDTIALATPKGKRDFLVARIVTDFTLDIGAITIDDGIYRKLWNDPLVNVFYIWGSPDVSTDALRAGVRRNLPAAMPASVLTAGEFKQGVAAALDDALGLTWAVELVAVVIAVIGVINFFLVEIADRRREIGLLRSVALGRSQLVGSFLVEAAWVGAVGGILAIVYGLPISWIVSTHSTQVLSGWSISFRFPAVIAVASIAIAALAALAAAFLPLLQAAREQPSDLLTTE